MPTSEFLDLIRRHNGLIQQIAWAWCRERSDRDDLVQDILVQLWRAHGRYDPSRRPSTWIHRIACNVAISFQRRHRRHHVRREPFDASLLVAVDAPEPNESVQRLLACVEVLPPLDRALVLLWLDDLDHAAIAAVLGLSVSNVGTRLFRIKDTLRVAFAERGRGQTPEPPHAS